MQAPNLPIIDISAIDSSDDERSRTAVEVRRALSESGFMYLKGYGIDSAVIERTFAGAAEFFAQPLTFKRQFAYTSVAANFGYQGIEAESLDPTAFPDLKEAFTMRNALAVAAGHSQWPNDEFRSAALSLFAAALGAAHRLLEIMTIGLALPRDYFYARHTGDNVTLRLLHYPANLSTEDTLQLGAGAHTDYGSITLLFQDDIGGLELRDINGEWQSAPPIGDSVVINTGDLMERWTNGYFRSTVHRVRPITGARDRYSIAVFVDPDDDVKVDCLPSCMSAERPARYPPITAGEHLRQKIAATHRAKSLAQHAPVNDS